MQQRRANLHKIPAEVLAQNKKAGTRYILFAVLVIALAFGIFSVVTAATDRFGLKIDLTSNKLYELTDTTKEILSGLEKPVSIVYCAAKSEADENLAAVLDNYDAASDMLEISYVDLDSNPAFAEKYFRKGISLAADGVLVSCGDFDNYTPWKDLYSYVSSTDSAGNPVNTVSGLQAEAKITGAVISVTTAEKPVIAFTAGHSELLPAGLENLLSNNNYEIIQSVLGVNSIDGASTIVIAGASRDFSEPEIAILKSFIDEGGSLAVFRSPETGSLPMLDSFLLEYGLKTGDRIVLEPSQQMDSPLNIIPNFAVSMISVYFSENSTYMVLPEARSLELSSPNGWITNTVLRSTSNSYGKLYSEMTSLSQDASDEKGPFTLAATSERIFKEPGGEEHNQYVFLAACTDLYDDTYLTMESIGNADFMLQLLSYMNGGGASVNIPAKSLELPDISISRGAVTAFTVIFVVLIPLCLIISGIWVFLKRRHS